MCTISVRERLFFMENFPTMITPYNKDGSIDYETAVKYVDWYFESGMDGIFSVCLSSEIFYLTLDERVSLNRVVYNRAKELEKHHGRKFTVVSSGHVSDSFEDQVKELNEIWNSGTDALIFITNRIDPNNEGDDVFIENTKRLMEALPKDARFGFYECPYPYKRLVTPKILKWASSTDRFDYMKDTCCDASVIKQRCEILKGSSLKLLNANCQTLLESMRDGGAGYCGIMCNYHPKLYTYLARHYADEPEKADLVQAIIGTFGFTENGLCYPLSAKYHMNLCGIPTENYARHKEASLLNEYTKSCMKRMKLATDFVEKQLGL